MAEQRVVSLLSLIKLDFDNIAYQELMNRIDFIKKDKIVKEIEIYQSTSLDGYHVYVKVDKELSFMEKMPYRKKWRDDGQRIVMDILKDDEKLKDVLFSYRMKKGKIIPRIFIKRVI